MSIWSSWEQIGWEPESEGIDARGRRRKWRAHFERGQVRAYRAGFSNHYPDDTDPGASVDIASIPSWCVPGHADDELNEHYGNPGPWLRLSINSPDAQTWWDPDPANRPKPAPVQGSVVLDEDAARALRDDLTAWLDREKARPE